MVTLVKMRKGQPSAEAQEVTRSGEALVPLVIRNAGAQAVESYLCHFAQLPSKHEMYVNRSATRHFLRWCEDGGLPLGGIRAGHVVTFFDRQRATWKASTCGFYFRALKRLFAHLESDRIIDRSPFLDAVSPKAPQPSKRRQALLGRLKSAVRDLDNDEEDSEDFRAGMGGSRNRCVNEIRREPVSSPG